MKKCTRQYARRHWEDWYQDSKKYFEKNGNLLIERHYVTEDGYKLGRWIERQRGIYNGKVSGGLTATQIRLLEKIHMVWKLENRCSWEEWMSKAQKYFAEYGDLAVPSDYVVDGYALGNWITECRKKYKKNFLDEKQIADLELCGMIWSLGIRRTFSDWYKNALDYYNEFGNLLVPNEYVTPDGFRLGVWISVQRAKYQHKHNRKPLTQKQIELLNILDMVWDISNVRERKWYEIYSDVALYKKIHGRLPIWPRDIKAQNGVSMHNWISHQRSLLADNLLPPEKIAKLNKIGIFAWKEVGNSASENENEGEMDDVV